MEDVFSGFSPYLRSVESNGEDASSEYKSVVEMEASDFIGKLKSKYPDLEVNEKDIVSDIKILTVSEGNRVKELKIGNKTIKGTDFRWLFPLRSTNFKIDKDENGKIRITVTGNGHGVGMSQWGANYLAKNGASYEEILKYYYKGVELSEIK